MLSLSRISAILILSVIAIHAQSTDKLGWASYLPGGAYDTAVATAVEPSGDVWVAGHSYGKYEAYGPNEPYQQNNAGASDIFVVKYRINPDGSSTVIFFTWLGGAGIDEVTDMKLDNYGRVVITGNTTSADFPMAGDAFQPVFGGDYDAFIAIIEPTQGGTPSLAFSSYYGGPGRELAKALAIGPTNNIAVVGTTLADDIPGVGTGAQPARRGLSDAFVFYFNPFEKGLNYVSYLGGAGADTGVAVAIDKNNRIWFAGSTGSDDFPITPNAVKPVADGFLDGYIACINPSLTGLDSFIYGSYIGGSSSDELRTLSLNADGKIWVSGITFSTDIPVTANAAQRTFGGGTDIFVMQIDPLRSGTDAILYSSYLGGNGHEFVYSLKQVDSTRVALAGYAMVGSKPVVGTENAFRRAAASVFPDGILGVIDTTKAGTAGIEYFSYFGGANTDIINGIDVDPADPKALFISGYTLSNDMRTTDGTTRPNLPGAPNAFAAKLLR